MSIWKSLAACGLTWIVLSAAAAGLVNPSFETDDGWQIAGEGGMMNLAVYGPIPDGERLMHFRETVWQNTGMELQRGQRWQLRFKASSYGSAHMTIEFRGAAEPDEAGTVSLMQKTIAFPSGQLWAFRNDVPNAERFFGEYTMELPVPDLPAGVRYLVIAFSNREGFAAIDDLSLELTPPPVASLPLKETLEKTVAEYCASEGKFLGRNDLGILWSGTRPLALALRNGDSARIKPWEGGKFWELTLDDGKSHSNLDAGAPRIATEKDGWSLTWTVASVEVTVTVKPRDGNHSLEFGFELDNRSGNEIRNFSLPAGWREPARGDGEWIIPAWIGTAVPMNNLEPIQILYPGHLHSQWYGFRDRGGFSWMIHSEDTEPSTKFLTIRQEEGDNISCWRHDVYLKPHRRYRASYPTVLTSFPDGDWNEMAEVYRKWAVTAAWFTPLAEKAAARPEILRLRQGWSWLRGMPPVKEVNGRQCDTTYAQALECMEGFRRRFGLTPLFWYTGWYGPFDSKYPEFFPVAPEMGGTLEAFAAASRERGNLVALHLNGAEWNAAANVFDKNKMARWKGRFYEASYGDEYSNFVVSYPCVLPVMRNYTDKIGNKLQLGIYYDVMGHVYAHDDNPAAGYDPDTIGRSNWNTAKLKAWKALREVAPRTYFQTEGTAEQAIPYVDCHSGGMVGWVMSSGRRLLPLWQMVYGDTGFYLPLYDGLGQANCSVGFALTPLMGAIQQFPQNIWETQEPFWCYIIRRQQLNGRFAGTRLLEYVEDNGWRRSRWLDGAVAVNDGGTVRDLALDGGGREVIFRDMGVSQAMRQRGAGSVAMFHSRGFSLDCGSAVEEGGRILWRSPDPETGVVVNGDTLLVFNGTNRVIRGEFQVTWPEFCRGKTFHTWDFRQCLEQEQPFRRDGETVFFDLELQPDSAIEIRSR